MKINQRQIRAAIKNAMKSKSSKEKIEVLWYERDGEIRFGGHSWAYNCWYSPEELKRNGTFKLAQDFNFRYYAIGSEANLTQKQMMALDMLTHEVFLEECGDGGTAKIRECLN